ncbi:MAG: uncharacterized protein JWM41_3058 [Gemmatimonadetes bacterium]|nr:uncharacterized protein [Gemmatimonadota bacterium]
MNRRDMLASLAVSLPGLPLALTSAAPRYVLHHVSATAPVAAPLERVDLAAWVSHLTSDEYNRCAPQHHGSVQAALPDGRRVFVSVETIDGNFMAHQYVAEIATPAHVRMISSASQIWLSPGESASMRVTWDVQLEAVSAVASRVVCDILVETADSALATRAAQRPANVPNPVQVHCALETPAFAADIERKAKLGMYSR